MYQSLLERWPNETLLDVYESVLDQYDRSVIRELRRRNIKSCSAVSLAYLEMCRHLEAYGLAGVGVRVRNHNGCEHFTATLVNRLRHQFAENWLQALSSILGMLMHFSLLGGREPRLTNDRRPQHSYTTYPNSPWVAAWLGQFLVDQLAHRQLRTTTRQLNVVDRYILQHLNFTVLDPSMESGSLLLAIAQAVCLRITNEFGNGTQKGCRIKRAALNRLYSDCLWGFDRSNLAVPAVRAILTLFAWNEIGEPVHANNLVRRDSLAAFATGRLGRFDCVINNPPWGERLTDRERHTLQTAFSSVARWTDTYVAFGELAIRSLRPQGVFGLILPSQVAGTTNTARLRHLLTTECTIDELVLLNRAAFADASVRGIVLVGKHGIPNPEHRCRATTSGLGKPLASIRRTNTRILLHRSLASQSQASWWPLLCQLKSRGLNSYNSIKLGCISDVLVGVQPYHVGKGKPRQTALTVSEKWYSSHYPIPDYSPAVRGADVRQFSLRSPKEYVRMGEWLAYPGRHASVLSSPRVFVRELHDRSGMLNAAVCTSPYIPLHGVLTLLPRKGVDVFALATLLNSWLVSDWVASNTASFTKVDFQRITVNELRRCPIPALVLTPDLRRRVKLSTATAREEIARADLRTIGRRLSAGGITDQAEAGRELKHILSALKHGQD
jgi:hypothetical protein